MLKSGDDGAPSTPEGAMRRPFSSTSVRFCAKAAQVRGSGAGAVVENEALKGEVELHARGRAGLLQNLAGVDEAGLALDVGADDLQRRDARVGAAPDARAGDDDLFDASLLGLRQGRQRGFVFGLLLLYRFGGVFGPGLLRQRRRRGDKPSEGQDRCEQQGRLGEVGLRRPSRHAQANDELRESHGGSPPSVGPCALPHFKWRLGRTFVESCSTLSHPAGAMSTPPTPFLHLSASRASRARQRIGQNMSRCRRSGRPMPRKGLVGPAWAAPGGKSGLHGQPLPITAQCDCPASPPADRFGVRRGPKTGVWGGTGSVRHTAAIDSARSAPP